ncbi:inducible metalloproteinase inhibitor protein [Teleopsis dalmanni]|uniref:inducible metalloproteinase inhibitor protein n=1 Tax=Teleopsis dalmanni TaxID=139649 RepID=UPI0018CF1733|nr:inducible metalloproteinase inhibitor protein [Teleopsis dalmanni]
MKYYSHILTGSSKRRCLGANECDIHAEPSCRPIGGCERFCKRGAECTRAIDDCYCRSGFARNGNGQCIPKLDCPRACGQFECHNSNPSCSCEMYCRRRPNCIVSLSGCHCARGFARDDNNFCVPQTMCPWSIGRRRFPITARTTTTKIVI